MTCADERVARHTREVYIAETSQKARSDALNGPLARSFLDYWKPSLAINPRGLGVLKVDPEILDEDITPEYMLERFWIVGDPDKVAEKIARLYEQAGGFGRLLLLCHDWGKEKDKWFNCLELRMKNVSPEIEALFSPRMIS